MGHVYYIQYKLNRPSNSKESLKYALALNMLTWLRTYNRHGAFMFSVVYANEMEFIILNCKQVVVVNTCQRT